MPRLSPSVSVPFHTPTAGSILSGSGASALCLYAHGAGLAPPDGDEEDLTLWTWGVLEFRKYRRQLDGGAVRSLLDALDSTGTPPKLPMATDS